MFRFVKFIITHDLIFFCKQLNFGQISSCLFYKQYLALNPLSAK